MFYSNLLKFTFFYLYYSKCTTLYYVILCCIPLHYITLFHFRPFNLIKFAFFYTNILYFPISDGFMRFIVVLFLLILHSFSLLKYLHFILFYFIILKMMCDNVCFFRILPCTVFVLFYITIFRCSLQFFFIQIILFYFIEIFEYLNFIFFQRMLPYFIFSALFLLFYFMCLTLHVSISLFRLCFLFMFYYNFFN